ncbi:hypothetical protein LRP50_18680 [Enterovibrio sp. ZSDZ42]|uniref:Uncharacterized protein n=1 Tax=Enterovibrio gelatinilyticus TaxID=2899819 RepID=A0ABT5R4F2_9GAMM|nr:hypothetical protein [Enterovibrio sp. ZSDZ42]MDD1795158.1 hypothetical protein [Enterovibrio sp. ZSDZ42]
MKKTRTGMIHSFADPEHGMAWHGMAWHGMVGFSNPEIKSPSLECKKAAVSFARTAAFSNLAER